LSSSTISDIAHVPPLLFARIDPARRTASQPFARRAEPGGSVNLREKREGAIVSPNMMRLRGKGTRMKLRSAARTLTVLLLFALASPSRGEDGELFYKGKTITIVVGYSPGGGYDQYARTLQRYFGRYLPGNPSVVVQNLPGAASMLAVRHLDSDAPKDGTVVTMFDPGLITTSLAAPSPSSAVNLSQYAWIGAMLRDIRVCYAGAATGIRNWDDMMKRKEFLIGSTAKGSAAYVNAAILEKVFHAPVRLVTGYPGSNEQRLAIENGELEGNCTSWSALPPDWLSGSKINLLARFSPVRPPDMPENVPYVGDLATSQSQKDLLTILNASSELGRPFITARQVPAAQVNMLRSAFQAVLADPGFIEDTKKQSLPLSPVSGEEAEKIVGTIYAAPPELVEEVKGVLD
jgi:tripartite-type tricarboxylate transporter receptor subunit TctC